MPNKFASGKTALAECDICGFRYKLSTLRKLTIKTKQVNIKACNECWNEDHPQLLLGLYPVNDPQAVRDPRSDFPGYAQSRSYTQPLFSVVGSGFIGNVIVVTN